MEYLQLFVDKVNERAVLVDRELSVLYRSKRLVLPYITQANGCNPVNMNGTLRIHHIHHLDPYLNPRSSVYLSRTNHNNDDVLLLDLEIFTKKDPPISYEGVYLMKDIDTMHDLLHAIDVCIPKD